LTSSEIESV
jgi:hypothetical protein